MLSVLLNVIFPVLVCVLVGYVWGKSRHEFAMDFVTRLVTYIGAPCLIVSTINETRLAWDDFLEMAQLSVAVMVGFALLGYGVFRLLKQDFRPLSLAVIFPNTGNMGLSLCLFAFGDQGLALALIIFVVIALVHFACGDFILLRGVSHTQRVLNIFRQPIFVASLFAMAQVWLGIELPRPIALTTELIGGMTIPLMLISLGVSLAAIHSSHWSKGVLIAVLRVPGGLLVALAVIFLLDVEGVPAKVLLLQSLMPSAVFNHFFALKYNSEVEAVASGVVISTILSFLILPFVLWFMLH